MRKLLPLIVFFAALSSCTDEVKKADKDTVVDKNVSTTISTDTARLAMLIDLSVYHPEKVKFKYIFVDNSGGNQRLTVPGPSDGFLSAVLYFDSATCRALRSAYFNIDYPDPGYARQEFLFDFLDDSLRSELLHTDSSYHGHPGTLLGIGSSGKLWFLHQKVLLTSSGH